MGFFPINGPATSALIWVVETCFLINTTSALGLPGNVAMYCITLPIPKKMKIQKKHPKIRMFFISYWSGAFMEPLAPGSKQ